MPPQTQTQKAPAAAIYVVIAIIVLALIGLGIYAYNNPSVPQTGNLSDKLDNNPVTTIKTETVRTVPVETTLPGSYTEVSPFPGGSVYQNGTYGLTLALPAGYTYTETVSNFQGFPNSRSINFSYGGQNVFTVNVFTKAQWNAIRTQENLAHQNVNSLGEGNYYGENTTYIFSSTINSRDTEVQSILNAGRFY